MTKRLRRLASLLWEDEGQIHVDELNKTAPAKRVTIREQCGELRCDMRQEVRVDRLASSLVSTDDSDDDQLPDLLGQSDKTDASCQTGSIERPSSSQSDSCERCQPFILSDGDITSFIAGVDRDALKRAGIQLMLNTKAKTAGIHFEHHSKIISTVIDRNGTHDLCCFKLGICAFMNLEQRMVSYRMKNFTDFVVSIVSFDLSLVECAEAHGIALFKHYAGCRNIQLGGESMRRNGIPRFEGPWCTYVVATRADRFVNIGS